MKMYMAKERRIKTRRSRRSRRSRRARRARRSQKGKQNGGNSTPPKPPKQKKPIYQKLTRKVRKLFGSKKESPKKTPEKKDQKHFDYNELERRVKSLNTPKSKTVKKTPYKLIENAHTIIGKAKVGSLYSHSKFDVLQGKHIRTNTPAAKLDNKTKKEIGSQFVENVNDAVLKQLKSNTQDMKRSLKNK